MSQFRYNPEATYVVLVGGVEVLSTKDKLPVEAHQCIINAIRQAIIPILNGEFVQIRGSDGSRYEIFINNCTPAPPINPETKVALSAPADDVIVCTAYYDLVWFVQILHENKGATIQQIYEVAAKLELPKTLEQTLNVARLLHSQNLLEILP